MSNDRPENTAGVAMPYGYPVNRETEFSLGYILACLEPGRIWFDALFLPIGTDLTTS